MDRKKKKLWLKAIDRCEKQNDYGVDSRCVLCKLSLKGGLRNSFYEHIDFNCSGCIVYDFAIDRDLGHLQRHYNHLCTYVIKLELGLSDDDNEFFTIFNARKLLEILKKWLKEQ